MVKARSQPSDLPCDEPAAHPPNGGPMHEGAQLHIQWLFL